MIHRGGTSWLQSKGHWQPRPTLRTFLSCCLQRTAVSPSEFKHSTRTFQHASGSVCHWLVIKSSLGEMSALLCEATRNRTVYEQQQNCAGKCMLQGGERERKRIGRNMEGQRHLTGTPGVSGILLAPIRRPSPWKSHPAGGSQPSCPERNLSRIVRGGQVLVKHFTFSFPPFHHCSDFLGASADSAHRSFSTSSVPQPTLPALQTEAMGSTYKDLNISAFQPCSPRYSPVWTPWGSWILQLLI